MLIMCLEISLGELEPTLRNLSMVSILG